jgi:hypothetical protein
MCDNVPYPEFYREKVQIARKQYRCCECHKPINAGNKYTYIAGKWEREFNSYRQCLSCNQLSKKVVSIGAYFCFGELIDTIRDCAALISFDEDSKKWTSNVDYIEMDGNIPRIKQT